MAYLLTALIFLVVLRVYAVRDGIAEIWRRCKAERALTERNRKAEAERRVAERCLHMSNALSRLTADDIKDIRKVRAAIDGA